jgi:hypothetical protein
MKGYFSEETLDKYAHLAAEKLDADFAEGNLYDFTTCIRPDGSAYGTGGKCRKGTEGEAKEKKAIDQLGSMLPKGEKIMDSKGGLHTAPGATKKPEKSVADKAMEMVRAKMEARGQTEIKRGESKPAASASPIKKPAVQGYDWRKQSGTFRKADND